MPDNNTTAPGGQDAAPGGQGNVSQQPAQGAANWESVLAGLPEEAKGLYEQHISGLKNAFEGEKERRRELSERLQEATSQLEAGSKARDQLEQLQQQLEETQRKADFATEASGQGVSNVKLAYLAAQEFETFDRRGNVQWDALREAAPELFAQQPAPRGNAGNGTQAPGNRPPDIDSIIRAKVGIR